MTSARAVRQLWRSPILDPLGPRFGCRCGPGPMDTLLWPWPYGSLLWPWPYRYTVASGLLYYYIPYLCLYPYYAVRSLIVVFLPACPPAFYSPSPPQPNDRLPHDRHPRLPPAHRRDRGRWIDPQRCDSCQDRRYYEREETHGAKRQQARAKHECTVRRIN